MKLKLLVGCLLVCASQYMHSMDSTVTGMQSFALVGKDNTKIFIPLQVAQSTDYFSDQIDDVGDINKPFNVSLEFKGANLTTLKHIEQYVSLRATSCDPQTEIRDYAEKLSGNELVRLVHNARLIFNRESMPQYLLSPLCKRMRSGDKSFDYSLLPRKVQDSMMKEIRG